MSSGRGDKKDDDEYISPFAGIDKSVVLQSARIFSDRDLRSKDAIPVMTKLLYLLTSGKEAFLENESIELFFQATKLFGNKNTLLRRLLYLLIKQLDIDSDNILMATASITKDINEAADTLKANAIRVLCAILDPAMLAQVERLIKQSIVSKSSNVAAAALVSSIHLMQTRSADVVARWTPEVTAALSGKDASVQFLALGLLHQLKSHDRLAVTRLVQNHTRGSSLRSPHALCYLIRIVADLMADADEVDSGLYDWLEIALRHKSEMVTLEAARAICGLPHVSSRELTPAVTVLQLFAGSVKATLRFAAVRTLHGLASVHPDAVATASVDLESLVSDSNRAISTLAITTLLKVGSESSVNRLVQQISDFISEIPDEYKIVVIDSVRSLSVKFPGKSRTMMGFLSSALRDDGSFSYKKAIVDSVIDIATNADGRAAALDILVEFIEDNEHSTLSCLVLDFVGREAPLTTSPAKYLRYIYNRVILEKASVRAAAVSALASIGLRVVALREQVVVLLQRVLMDVDDEVRDRATFFLSVLASEGDAGGAAELMEESAISLKNLEASLIEYQNAGNTEHSFKLSDVPIEIVAAEVTPAASSSSPAVRARNESARQLAALAQVPQLAALGKPYRTSKAIPLTDAESEFVVSVVKHSYVERMVFQFTVTNTVEDVLLENVVVEMEPDDDDFAAAGNVALPILRYGPPGVCFAVFELDGCPTGTFACSMQMVAKDVDPETGDAVDDGVPDEYPLEDLDVTISDFVASTAIPDFASGWEKLGEESVEVFVLPSFGTVPTAIASLLEFLGVAACDRTDNAEADATAHTLLGSGIFSGSVPFVIRARLKVTDSGVAVELTVRSTDAGVAELIASSVA